MKPFEKIIFGAVVALFATMVSLIMGVLLLTVSADKILEAQENSKNNIRAIFNQHAGVCIDERAEPRLNSDFQDIGVEALYGTFNELTHVNNLFYTEGTMRAQHQAIDDMAENLQGLDLTFCFDRALQLGEGNGNYNIGAVYYVDQRLLTINPVLFNDNEFSEVLNNMLLHLNDNIQNVDEDLMFMAQGRGVRPLKSRDYWTPLADWNIQAAGGRYLPEPPLRP